MIRSLLLLPLLLATLAAADSSIREDAVAVAGGGTTPRLTLSNGLVSIAVLPGLGAKISSLTDASGREYLCRSDKPYRTRHPGAPFKESEFDGIDECFPTVGGCDYPAVPASPWAGLKIPDHGELWSQPWTPADGPGLTLEAHGILLPFRMRRSITLDGAVVSLAYTVNNDADVPLQYLYAFHALLAGDTGCGMQWPAEQPILLSYSRKATLGTSGTTVAWGALTVDGAPFSAQQFVRDSGRYYKYFASPLQVGQAVAKLADGATLTMDWPVTELPHLALWCSEGNVGHHLGVEPTTAPVDTLAQAAAAGQARTIPAHGTVSWRIRLALAAPPARP